jgi:hypothetical protein
MKHFLPLSLAAALLLSANNADAAAPRAASHQSIDKLMQSPAKLRTEARKNLKENLVQKRTARANSRIADASATPITEVTGTVKEYTTTTTDYLYFWGYTFDFTDTGYAGEIVFDGNTAYIKDPIPSLSGYNTYMKGSVDGNKITVSFPQPIISEDGYTYYVDRCVYDSENSEEYSAEYTVDDSATLSYTINEDGSITSDWTDANVILGLTYDNEWMGYGSYAVEYVPFDGTKLTIADMPADFAEKLNSNWAVLSDEGNVYLSAAEYNGKFYIAGLFTSDPDALLVGDIDGTTVTFTSNQYMGVDDYYGYRTFFYGLDAEEYYDDYYEEYYTAYNLADNVTMTYSAEENKLSNANRTLGFIGGDTSDPDYLTTTDTYTNATIILVPEDISLVPADPTDLEYYAEGGEAGLYFELSANNVDGWPLNEDNLYYRIYDSSNIFTFTSDVYVNVPNNTTDLPWNESYLDSDEYYYDICAEEGNRYVWFYAEPTNPGIQAVYKDGDTEYTSNIVYVDSSSIRSILADKNVASTTYYDLSGRRVAANALTNGIYLKTVKYTDGTTATTKVAR